MIPAWTPNNSIFRDWARLVCTKLVMGWVRAHCGACHQSMGHHHGASSWGIYTDSWGIIIWSMSMHKRMQHATMQLAIAPLSVPRMSFFMRDITLDSSSGLHERMNSIRLHTSNSCEWHIHNRGHYHWVSRYKRIVKMLPCHQFWRCMLCPLAVAHLY